VSLEHCGAACLVVLAIWILLSGLDDLFIDLVYFLRGRAPFSWPDKKELASLPQRRIAILVPLWQEQAVVGRMLRHNRSVICYSNYDFFVGVYPNDGATMEAVQEVADCDSRVHLAVCRHNGPTSKADCLNRAYDQMTDYEALHRVRFDVVMTHDAEDLIHPESLRLVNWFSRDYQMVQVPVLPLPTPAREWTHGLYCDEFAEYQSKDIPVRQILGGFLPSNGVGTGFDRAALDRLRHDHSGLAFDPECLTEDYESGFRMHAAGYRQIFLPIQSQPQAGSVIATREYFPRRSWPAVRQRSRWVAGITLQGWERHGWRVPLWQKYWFWRDRKGLVGNLLSPITNIVLFLWLAHLAAAIPIPRWLTPPLPFWLSGIGLGTGGLALLQIGIRMHLSSRFFGIRFAAISPLRAFWGNALNCAATLEAIRLFVTARLRRHAPDWRKTEHAYPGEPLHIHHRPRLGEVLVSLRYLSARELEEALPGCPRNLRLGEYLVQRKKITEWELERALSAQSGRPPGRLTAGQAAHVVHRNFGLDST
jgi:adsorption protein B